MSRANGQLPALGHHSIAKAKSQIPNPKSQIPNPQPPPPVIIALTASAFEEDRVTILAAGCDDIVNKPFRKEVIFEKMAEYLGVRYLYAEKPVGKDISRSGAAAPGGIPILKQLN